MSTIRLHSNSALKCQDPTRPEQGQAGVFSGLPLRNVKQKKLPQGGHDKIVNDRVSLS